MDDLDWDSMSVYDHGKAVVYEQLGIDPLFYRKTSYWWDCQVLEMYKKRSHRIQIVLAFDRFSKSSSSPFLKSFDWVDFGFMRRFFVFAVANYLKATQKWSRVWILRFVDKVLGFLF